MPNPQFRGHQFDDNTIPAGKLANLCVESRHMATTAKQAALDVKNFRFPKVVNSKLTLAASSVAVTDEVFTNAFIQKIGADLNNKGVITTASNNLSEIQDALTKQSIFDSSNRRVFGRITGTPTNLTGTLTFTNGSATVSGVGCLFTSELTVGSYLRLNADNTFYKVLSIANDNSLQLTSVFSGTTGSGVAAKVILTLSFFVLIAGVETAHTMSSETIDFSFNEVYSLNDAALMGFSYPALSQASIPLSHTHDTRYPTLTSLVDTSPSGSLLVGVDVTPTQFAMLLPSVPVNVQELFEALMTFAKSLKKIFVRERLTTSVLIVPNDDILTVVDTPSDPAQVRLIVDGLYQDNSVDFSMVGVNSRTVRWIKTGVDITIGSKIVVEYFKDTP